MNNEGISLIDTKKGIPRLNFRFDKDYPEDFIINQLLSAIGG